MNMMHLCGVYLFCIHRNSFHLPQSQRKKWIHFPLKEKLTYASGGSNMPLFSIPPGYQSKNPPHKPKLAPFIGVIDAILESD
jgi:hypothetical protein